jgi:hypothetical protein
MIVTLEEFAGKVSYPDPKISVVDPDSESGSESSISSETGSGYKSRVLKNHTQHCQKQYLI